MYIAPSEQNITKTKRKVHLRKGRVIFAGILLFLIIFSAFFTLSNKGQSNIELTKAQFTSTPKPVNPKIKKINVEIDALIAEYSSKGLDNVSIIIKDNQIEDTLNISSETIYPTASLYKLFVLWELQKQIEQGKITSETQFTLGPSNDKSDEDGGSIGNYGDTLDLDYARKLMIEESNNTATFVLLEKLTKSAVQETLNSNGYKDTNLTKFTTSAKDIFRLIDGIYNKNLDPILKESDYNLMLDLLKNQKINNALNEGLDEGTVFAHKTANIDTNVHDAGIIILPTNHAIFVTVMTKGTNYASYGFLSRLGALITQDLIKN